MAGTNLAGKVLVSLRNTTVRPWRAVGSSLATSKLPPEPTNQVLPGTSWSILANQHWLVTGPNGSGKTTLVRAIFGGSQVIGGTIKYGKEFSRKKVAYVSHAEHNHLVSLSEKIEKYGSWNRFKKENLTVMNVLRIKNLNNNEHELYCIDEAQSLIKEFGLNDLAERQVTTLSSGELRKVVILRTLLSKPKLLILDEVFDGLDYESRILVGSFLRSATRLNNSSLQIVAISHRYTEIQHLPMITHVIKLGKENVEQIGSISEFNLTTMEHSLSGANPLDSFKLFQRLKNLQPDPVDVKSTILEMNGVNVSIEGNEILHDIHWKIENGEHHLVSGKNGSGKSSLLALVNGENPVVYGQPVKLLGKSRDSWSRLSIFHLRKAVATVSPKLQLTGQYRQKVLTIIRSGEFGTFGYCPPGNLKQVECAKLCAELAGVSSLVNNNFTEISQGEQRRVLLARALMGRPNILILDEPFHGLDGDGRALFLNVVKDIIKSNYCTVIFVSHHGDEIPDGITHELSLSPSPKGSMAIVSKFEN